MRVSVFARQFCQKAAKRLTRRSPNAGLGGENSTARTLPFAPPSTALSIHRPSLFPGAEEEDVDGSSQILTVRSCPQDAIKEPWIGCANDILKIGASWACGDQSRAMYLKSGYRCDPSWTVQTFHSASSSHTLSTLLRKSLILWSAEHVATAS